MIRLLFRHSTRARMPPLFRGTAPIAVQVAPHLQNSRRTTECDLLGSMSPTRTAVSRVRRSCLEGPRGNMSSSFTRSWLATIVATNAGAAGCFGGEFVLHRGDAGASAGIDSDSDSDSSGGSSSDAGGSTSSGGRVFRADGGEINEAGAGGATRADGGTPNTAGGTSSGGTPP